MRISSMVISKDHRTGLERENHAQALAHSGHPGATVGAPAPAQAPGQAGEGRTVAAAAAGQPQTLRELKSAVVSGAKPKLTVRSILMLAAGDVLHAMGFSGRAEAKVNRIYNREEGSDQALYSLMIVVTERDFVTQLRMALIERRIGDELDRVLPGIKKHLDHVCFSLSPVIMANIKTEESWIAGIDVTEPALDHPARVSSQGQPPDSGFATLERTGQMPWPRTTGFGAIDEAGPGSRQGRSR